MYIGKVSPPQCSHTARFSRTSPQAPQWFQSARTGAPTLGQTSRSPAAYQDLETVQIPLRINAGVPPSLPSAARRDSRTSGPNAFPISGLSHAVIGNDSVCRSAKDLGLGDLEATVPAPPCRTCPGSPGHPTGPCTCPRRRSSGTLRPPDRGRCGTLYRRDCAWSGCSCPPTHPGPWCARRTSPRRGRGSGNRSSATVPGFGWWLSSGSVGGRPSCSGCRRAGNPCSEVRDQ